MLAFSNLMYYITSDNITTGTRRVTIPRRLHLYIHAGQLGIREDPNANHLL